MRRFGDHGDTMRLEDGIQTRSDLSGHFLLDLQAAGKDLDQPRQFGNADHPVARQIADVNAADDRCEVMLAMRLKADVAQHYDFVVTAGFLEGAFEVIARIVFVTGEPFLVRAHHARRGGNEPSALRIVAGPADQCAYRIFGLRARRPPIDRHRLAAPRFVVHWLVHEFSLRPDIRFMKTNARIAISPLHYSRRNATSSTRWLSLFF